MRDQPINSGVEKREGISPPRMIVPRVCVGLIMVMWVVAGYSKVRDMSGFIDTITEHAVLPQNLYGMLWWVGPGELVMGFALVFVMGSELRKLFGRAVLVISMLSIAGFTYYLSMVSDAVLLESGCGCFKLVDRVHFGMDDDVRTVRYVFNGTVILLHLVALFAPSVIERRYKERVAAAELD
ncbi:MAG: MauE/DoxX family redox-associated membrane protein [Phycisphaerales bacterium]